MSLAVEMNQHPVGQGGLFSGRLDCDSHSLRWIYDCGSNNGEALRREVSRVASDGKIDILFLSHLDSDHVNGIDQLLTAQNVSEVVIPYLTASEFQLILAQDIERTSLTGNFLDFAENVPAWFMKRGVKTVTFIDPAEEDGASEAETGPTSPPDTPPETGDSNYKWSEQPKIREVLKDGVVQHFGFNARVFVSFETQRVDWVLIPYAYKPAKWRMAQFEKSIKAKFGHVRSIKSLRKLISHDVGREKLRECYDKIWNSHNLVSMSLYSGPVDRDASDWRVIGTHINHSIRFPHNWHPHSVGWLSTGDANLSGLHRRKAFLNHYKDVLPNTNAFVVPHHGAAGSFHPQLVEELLNLNCGIAAAGIGNQYGHPHEFVVAAFHAHHKPFLKVSEDTATGVVVCATT